MHYAAEYTVEGKTGEIVSYGEANSERGDTTRNGGNNQKIEHAEVLRYTAVIGRIGKSEASCPSALPTVTLVYIPYIDRHKYEDAVCLVPRGVLFSVRLVHVSA